MTKHLILLKIQNMMDVKVVLLQRFVNVLIKKTSGGVVKNENMLNQCPLDIARVAKVSNSKVSDRT